MPPEHGSAFSVVERLAGNAGTDFGAPRLSPEFLAAEYDKAHVVALQALDRIAERDWQQSVPYPDWDPMLSGEVTYERRFPPKFTLPTL